MGTIRAAMAGMERTEILERVWSAKEEKRRRGELAQSPIVLGYGIGYEKGRGFFYTSDAERVRAAFQQFLAGAQSYKKLAEMVGVTPRGMHLILRNPIWTGWRVIDKKRDPSAAGKYKGVNGRQSDRRKIARAPEDIIRVQVIETPLISVEDFETTQHIMDLKQQNHWRTRADYVHRFAYNGFLTCSMCEEPVHTALARRDYYACKGRRTAHKCLSKYMVREKLEKGLDELFAEHLTKRCFLEQCLEVLQQRSAQNDSEVAILGLTQEIKALHRKRERIVDSFIDGELTREARDQRLTAVDRGIRSAQEGLAREAGAKPPAIEQLIEAFAPLAEWEYWTREQKRSVLSTLVPEIRVADYKIESLGLNPLIFSNEDTHRDMGSSRRPA
jgi:hypothetical protein